MLCPVCSNIFVQDKIDNKCWVVVVWMIAHSKSNVMEIMSLKISCCELPLASEWVDIDIG